MKKYIFDAFRTGRGRFYVIYILLSTIHYVVGNIETNRHFLRGLKLEEF